MRIRLLVISAICVYLSFSLSNGIYCEEKSELEGKGEVKPISGELNKDKISGSSGSSEVTEINNNVKEKSIPGKKPNGLVKEIKAQNRPGKDDPNNKLPDNQDPNENINNFLLQINDGDYKYLRIYGYETKSKDLSKSGAVEEKTEVETAKISEKIEIKEINGKGFLGLKKDTGNMLAKGGLVFLIFLIFLLYRIRTKRAGGRVVKRYPK